MRVWDTVTGAAAIQPLEGHTAGIQAVTFSYDGRLIISGSLDSTIRLWDTRTGKSAGKPIYVGARVYSVVVSPDGSKIVGGCYGGTMTTYDAAAGTKLFSQYFSHKRAISSLAFSPDGHRIVSATRDEAVRISDVSASDCTGHSLNGHTSSVSSVAFSPDGRYIASGSFDKTIRIWDASTGVQTDSLHGHVDQVYAVAFTPDGSALVSGSFDKTIKLWNVRGTEILGDRNDLTTCSTYPISSGGFGDIYRCKLKNNIEVAIKTVRLYVDSSEQSQKHIKYAARELYTWSKCRHPNVQRLLGLVMFRDQIGMVAAWESNGDMPRYLQQNPDTDRCRMSVKIVQGLWYLHDSGVVHGDLKGANVLISEDGSPRLADFGNAALHDFSLRFTSSSTKAGLSPRWAAPELFEDAKCNAPADIYALGMTILVRHFLSVFAVSN
ncbi:hypothetical protein FRC09_008200 [Ceratobasidium sp. 395]|nr:hypothetical protein FRC09_008200 [Ceratobasidium sp. 395]